MTHRSPYHRPLQRLLTVRPPAARCRRMLSALVIALTPLQVLVPAAPAAALAPTLRPGSAPFLGAPRVGAVFATVNGRPNGHFCTASVVDSPGHDLLVTAAHCVVAPGSGRARDGLVFVPGYRSGQEPYGRWRVRAVVVDIRWAQHGDPDYDVAFLKTVPVTGARRVQDAVGAEAIAFNAPHRVGAVAVGYPSGTEIPVRCRSSLHEFGGGQSEFDCPGLPNGTSGGPLLAGGDPAGAGRGTVVGVIGGYQQGGLSPDVSYTPYFGSGIAQVYRKALAVR